MIRSTLRCAGLVIVCAFVALPNAFAAPPKSLITKPPVEEVLRGLPYVEVSEVLSLAPSDQDAFATIIIGMRGKYHLAFSRLPRKYLNVADSDAALLKERREWFARRDEQLERFSVEAINLRRDFRLISPSQAAYMRKAAQQGEASAGLVRIAATATPTPGSKPPAPPVPPAPKCGGVSAPKDKISTYVCVCAGTPKAGWELATQNITAVHPCTGQLYVKTQITNEWKSQTSSSGDCMAVYKSEKTIYSDVVKSSPLKCGGSGATPTPTAEGTCGVNQTTTTIDHTATNCPRGSKSAIKDVKANSIVTVKAIPPTCEKRSWTYSSTSDKWTSTYNCDLTCTGCRNDEVVGP